MIEKIQGPIPQRMIQRSRYHSPLLLDTVKQKVFIIYYIILFFSSETRNISNMAI